MLENDGRYDFKACISPLNLTSETARLSPYQLGELQAARQCARPTKDNKKPLHILETIAHSYTNKAYKKTYIYIYIHHYSINTTNKQETNSHRLQLALGNMPQQYK